MLYNISKDHFITSRYGSNFGQGPRGTSLSSESRNLRSFSHRSDRGEGRPTTLLHRSNENITAKRPTHGSELAHLKWLNKAKTDFKRHVNLPTYARRALRFSIRIISSFSGRDFRVNASAGGAIRCCFNFGAVRTYEKGLRGDAW